MTGLTTMRKAIAINAPQETNSAVRRIPFAVRTAKGSTKVNNGKHRNKVTAQNAAKAKTNEYDHFARHTAPAQKDSPKPIPRRGR